MWRIDSRRRSAGSAVSDSMTDRESPTPDRETLLPVARSVENPDLPLELYSRALRDHGLDRDALEEVQALIGEPAASLGRAARLTLLQALLDQGAGDSLWVRSETTQRAVLGSVYRALPYYQATLPIRRDLRPSRVEVRSAVRIDLAMGGLSDLPPWTNEQPGRAVSLCALIDGRAPIWCEAEIQREAGLWLEAVGRAAKARLTEWSELEDIEAPTAILRASVRHLLGNEKRDRGLEEVISSIFGGGLAIRTHSHAPKGLGSSSILASVVLQSLLRLLGQTIEWQDVVHRTVAVERLTGVGGGWEDALPLFHGGIVLAQSTPARLPIIDANQVEVSPAVSARLSSVLVLFDTELKGYTGDILAEGMLRYVAGERSALQASRELLDVAEKVVTAVQAGDLELLGSLMCRQWDLWKTVTGGACTTPELERLLEGAARFIHGVKPNGAGAGGTVLFVAREGERDALVDYLSRCQGRVVQFAVAERGYETREWYHADLARDFIRNELPRVFRERSSFEHHGEITCSEVRSLDERRGDTLVGPLNPEIFDLLADVPLTVAAVAAALSEHIGSATAAGLRSTKKLVDAVASSVFSDEMKRWSGRAPVSTSEAKDEHGDEQPSVATTNTVLPLGTAVDVVDGTTLAATEAPGAYSICAVGEGLRPFPDLQAYAILAPAAALSRLDLRSRPEEAVASNVAAIAEALNKPVNQLTIVTHSGDTGQHHRTMIETMRGLGIRVIIPDPVIVEPPFVAAAAIRRQPEIDGMIGVFGLPEIAINTVLAGILDRGWEIVFRVAGNAMLARRDAVTFDGAFDFTDAERAAAAERGLDLGAIYRFADIVTGRGCLFGGAAVTRDEILGIDGVRKEGTAIHVDGWLADPCGNLHGLSFRFDRPALVDYTARYPQPLFDISLVVPLDAIDPVARFATNIRHTVPAIDGRAGLHATVCEFAVEYCATPSEGDISRAWQRAKTAVAQGVNAIRGPRTLGFREAVRTASGVRIFVELDETLQHGARLIEFAARGEPLFETLRVPSRPHVTIARFTEVVSRDVVMRVDELIEEFNGQSHPDISVARLLLRRATQTPFEKIADDVSIFLSD